MKNYFVQDSFVQGGPEDAPRHRKIIAHTLKDVQTPFRIAEGRCRLIAAPLRDYFTPAGRTNVPGPLSGLAAARPGDLIWIREPFIRYTPTDPTLAGHITPASADPEMRWGPARSGGYRAAPSAPSEMTRFQSCLTLCITAIRTGDQAVLLSLLNGSDARAAGFADADSFIADLRAGSGFFGAAGGATDNPLMVVAEFIAWRANIETIAQLTEQQGNSMGEIVHFPPPADSSTDFRPGDDVISRDRHYRGIIRKCLPAGAAHPAEIELQRAGGLGAVRLPVHALARVTPGTDTPRGAK